MSRYFSFALLIDRDSNISLMLIWESLLAAKWSSTRPDEPAFSNLAIDLAPLSSMLLELRNKLYKALLFRSASHSKCTPFVPILLLFRFKNFSLLLQIRPYESGNTASKSILF